MRIANARVLNPSARRTPSARQPTGSHYTPLNMRVNPQGSHIVAGRCVGTHQYYVQQAPSHMCASEGEGFFSDFNRVIGTTMSFPDHKVELCSRSVKLSQDANHSTKKSTSCFVEIDFLSAWNATTNSRKVRLCGRVRRNSHRPHSSNLGFQNKKGTIAGTLS